MKKKYNFVFLISTQKRLNNYDPSRVLKNVDVKYLISDTEGFREYNLVLKDMHVNDFILT